MSDEENNNENTGLVLYEQSNFEVALPTEITRSINVIQNKIPQLVELRLEVARRGAAMHDKYFKMMRKAKTSKDQTRAESYTEAAKKMADTITQYKEKYDQIGSQIEDLERRADISLNQGICNQLISDNSFSADPLTSMIDELLDQVNDEVVNLEVRAEGIVPSAPSQGPIKVVDTSDVIDIDDDEEVV